MPLDDTITGILAEGLGLAKYEADPDKADVLVVFVETTPLGIVPISPRAKSLFTRWGMPESCTGIDVPDDAMDLIKSLPANWLVMSADPAQGVHKFAQITLPQPLVVVH